MDINHGKTKKNYSITGRNHMLSCPSFESWTHGLLETEKFSELLIPFPFCVLVSLFRSAGYKNE